MASRLSLQWVRGNSCTLTHDVHISGTKEQKTEEQAKQGA